MTDESNFLNPTDWIVPPPFKKVRELVNDLNVNLPGELKLSDDNLLFKDYMIYSNPADDYKQIYNNFVSVLIEKRLKLQDIDFGDGRVVKVVRVLIDKPIITDSERGSSPLYPWMCRYNGSTYGTTIYIDLSMMKGDECIGTLSKIEFGKIPVMTGSILCRLYGMTDEELLKAKECPKDPLGLFVINGNEKIIITQEKLRYNRIFIMLTGKESKKQYPVCKTTNYSLKGTSVIELKTSSAGGIRITLKFLNKDNTLNIFQVFRLFGIEDYKQMEDMVLIFVKNNKSKVSLKLVASFNELLSVSDDVDDVETKKGKFENSDDLSYEKKKEMIVNMINAEIFPHIINDSPSNKLFLLAMMTAKFCEYLIAQRKLDDRDHCGNKRYETGGRSLESLFNQITKFVFETIQGEIQEQIKKGAGADLITVKQKFSLKKKDVTESFYESFGTNNWGLKSGQHSKQEGMTDIFKRESVISTYHQLTKINAQTSVQTKQNTVRMVHKSQIGFVDIVDTPDGDRCGLVKYKALTAQVTIDNDENVVLYYLEKFLNFGEYEGGLNPCILNGRPIGWCNGEYVKKELVSLKRVNIIYKDTCIVYDDKDGILYIYTDGGRLIRPLLVVNNETGNLIYDELKDKYGLDFVRFFPNLERMGAIEYLDPWEVSYADVSQSYKEFQAYKYLYEEAQNNRDMEYFQKLLVESDNELVNHFGKRFIYSETIAMDFTTFRNRFSHVELNPNSMFGVTSGLTPFPEFTQGPRLQFTCLPKTELIMMENGSKMIQNVVIGDIVKSYASSSSPESSHSKLVLTKIVGIKKNKPSHKLYTLITNCGRVRLTANHPILTPFGYKSAEDVVPGDLLINVVHKNQRVISKYEYEYDDYVYDIEVESKNHNFISHFGFVLHNCGMSRQAAGIIHSNQMFRFDTPSKTLAWPSRPITETQLYSISGVSELPNGETVKLAFMTYLGYNQEDAIIVKRGSIERGLFQMVIYRSWKVIASPNPDFIEEFMKPDNNNHEFRHLDEHGIVKEGSKVDEGDVIISKKRTYSMKTDGKPVINYDHTKIGIGEGGVIELVIKTTNPEGHPMIRVKIRQIKSPAVGDKFASRTAQKSTIGLILDDALMPYDEFGVSPDIIINPHAMPTRMTINKLYEMVFSKYGSYTAQRIDASGFNNFKLDEARAFLRNKGLNEDLNVKMYSGITGKPLEADIFTGLCYYYSLRHHVKDKIQARARGSVESLVRQPVSSRKKGGGMRFGEMEKDSMLSHGAAFLQRERMFFSSDFWSGVVCRKCDNWAITNYEKDRTFNTCRNCGKDAQFGILRIPYAFKTLKNMLEALGTNVKIHTEVLEESVPLEEIKVDYNLEDITPIGGGADMDYDYE